MRFLDWLLGGMSDPSSEDHDSRESQRTVRASEDRFVRTSADSQARIDEMYRSHGLPPFC